MNQSLIKLDLVGEYKSNICSHAKAGSGSKSISVVTVITEGRGYKHAFEVLHNSEIITNTTSLSDALDEYNKIVL